MIETKKYTAIEICNELRISMHTLSNWYQWERKRLKSGEVKEHYLPEPEVLTDVRGKPRIWSGADVKKLRQYQDQIVVGSKGIYGKYTNPNHPVDKHK